MTDAMSRRRHTRDTGSDHCNTLRGKVASGRRWRRRHRGKHPVNNSLKDDIEKAEELKDRVSNPTGEQGLALRRGHSDGGCSQLV